MHTLTFSCFFQPGGIGVFFDVDDLKEITQGELNRCIHASCVLLVFLDEGTFESEWCLAEVRAAAAAGLPIACVIDIDEYSTRELISKIRAQHPDIADLIFITQCIEYSRTYRLVAIETLRTLLMTQVPRIMMMCVTCVMSMVSPEERTLTPGTTPSSVSLQVKQMCEKEESKLRLQMDSTARANGFDKGASGNWRKAGRTSMASRQRATTAMQDRQIAHEVGAPSGAAGLFRVRDNDFLFRFCVVAMMLQGMFVTALLTTDGWQ